MAGATRCRRATRTRRARRRELERSQYLVCRRCVAGVGHDAAARFVCRGCGRFCCEHLCGAKARLGPYTLTPMRDACPATCSSCQLRGGNSPPPPGVDSSTRRKI